MPKTCLWKTGCSVKKTAIKKAQCYRRDGLKGLKVRKKEKKKEKPLRAYLQEWGTLNKCLRNNRNAARYNQKNIQTRKRWSVSPYSTTWVARGITPLFPHDSSNKFFLKPKNAFPLSLKTCLWKLRIQTSLGGRVLLYILVFILTPGNTADLYLDAWGHLL